MAEKQTQVTIKGLAQNPNPFGNLEPGTCSVADNVVIRRKGVMSPLPGNTVLKTKHSTTKFPVKMFGGERFDYFFTILKESALPATTLEILNSGGTNTTWTNQARGTHTYNFQFDPAQTHQTFARDRFFFTEHSSPVVFDLDTTDNSLSIPRPAGISPPVLVSISFNSPGANDIAIVDDNMYAAYKAVVRRKKDTYEITSAPTTAWIGFNGTLGTSARVDLTVLVDPNIDSALAGDFIDVYKTKQATSLDEIGDDYRLCVSYEILSADIVSGSIQFTDKCPDDSRGAPLYTNEEQEGASALNLMPPPSRDVITHKDINWYVTKNTWPVATINIPSRFGDLTGATSAQREHGIGRRTFIGDTTNGSSNITNVSAADRVGLLVGQAMVNSSGIFDDDALIGGITGSGPYTIHVTGTPAGSTTTGTTFKSADTMEIRATKDGATFSGTIPLETGVGNLAFNLMILNTSSLYGFRLILGGNYDSSADYVDGVNMTIWSPISGLWDSFELIVSNGQNYSPATQLNASFSSISSVQDTQTNRVFFSKSGLPESVAATNYLNVGAGKILKLWPTQSSIFALCTDGLWRIAGDGTNWQVEQLDPTVNLLHPDTVCSLNNQIFAWLTDGISIIGDQGSQTISTDAVGPQLREYIETFRAAGAPDMWGPTMTGDNYRKEVWLNLSLPPRVEADENLEQTFYTSYIVNMDTGSFTTQSETAILCLAFNPFLLRTITATWDEIDTNDISWFKPSESSWCKPTVVFNPLTAGDTGSLKQWMDVNYLFQEFDIQTGFTQGLFQASFDGAFVPSARAVESDSIKKIHYWVPRRVALSEQLNLGFKTVVIDDSITGTFNFNLYGFTVRYRTASDTFKR